MESDATISRCGNYRYVLKRTWNDRMPALGIVGLNPSTADATVDDPTVQEMHQTGPLLGVRGDRARQLVCLAGHG